MTRRILVSTILLLFLVITACNSQEESTLILPPLPQANTNSSTPTPSPTPPPREWSMDELLDCDTSTLTRQMAGETDAGLLSDCEVAVMVAHLTLSGAILELPPTEQTYVNGLADNLTRMATQMDKITEDAAVDSTEAAYLCEVLPQWEQHAQELRDWLTDRDPEEWRSLMMDVARFDRLANGLNDACNQGSGK